MSGIDQRRCGKRCAPRVTLLAAAALATWVLALPAPVAAQAEDPFEGTLFDVELVMGSQEAIGLTPEQRDDIIAALQRTQSAVVPWELSLSASAERLLGLLGRPRIDLESALSEVEETLRFENRVKLEHVRLLVEIKNLLTVEQQRELEAIRDSR